MYVSSTSQGKSQNQNANQSCSILRLLSVLDLCLWDEFMLDHQNCSPFLAVMSHAVMSSLPFAPMMSYSLSISLLIGFPLKITKSEPTEPTFEKYFVFKFIFIKLWPAYILMSNYENPNLSMSLPVTILGEKYLTVC